MKRGKTRRLNLILNVLIIVIFPLKAEQPGYGYLLYQDSICDIWWAEGAVYELRSQDGNLYSFYGCSLEGHVPRIGNYYKINLTTFEWIEYIEDWDDHK